MLNLHPYNAPYPENTNISPPVATSDSTASISFQTLQQELAIMLQSLLNNLCTMVKEITSEQKENAQTAHLTISVASTSLKKMLEEKKQLLDAEVKQKEKEAEVNKLNFWQKVWHVFTKYILPCLTVCIAFILGGPAGALAVAAVTLLTLIPVHNGKNVFALASQKLTQLLTPIFHLNENQQKILEGSLEITIAIAVAVGSGAAAAAAAPEKIGMVIEEEIEMTTIIPRGGPQSSITASEENGIEATESNNVSNGSLSRFVSISNGTTILSNSQDCFSNIFYGCYMEAHPHADKEMAKLYAKIFSAALNIIVALSSVATCAWAQRSDDFAKGLDRLSNISPSLSKFVENAGKTIDKLMFAVNATQAGTSIAQGVFLVQLGKINEKIAEMQGDTTKLQGNLDFTSTLHQQLMQESAALQAYQQNMHDEYASLLKHDPHFASPAFTEAKAIK
jgi:phosphoribosyl-ATP pyrophosphohydrolase